MRVPLIGSNQFVIFYNTMTLIKNYTLPHFSFSPCICWLTDANSASIGDSLSTLRCSCCFVNFLPLLFARKSVLEKEDWKNVVGLVTNAKQVVSSVQDVARKLADYAQFRGQTNVSGKDLLACSF